MYGVSYAETIRQPRDLGALAVKDWLDARDAYHQHLSNSELRCRNGDWALSHQKG
jgi:hypothetical protein